MTDIDKMRESAALNARQRRTNELKGQVLHMCDELQKQRDILGIVLDSEIVRTSVAFHRHSGTCRQSYCAKCDSLHEEWKQATKRRTQA